MRTEADVARAQRDHPVRQFEPLQDYLGMTRELLERPVRVSRRNELHELDFLELVLTNHAARVLAIGTRFRTETRRMRRIAQR